MTIEVTFRTLKGAVFKLPAEESDTILELKRKVATHQNVNDHAAYKLIHKGKILQDAATVSSSSITAAGFVVVMPPKKLSTKPKASSAASSKQTQPTSNNETKSNTAPELASSKDTKEDTKMTEASSADKKTTDSTADTSATPASTAAQPTASANTTNTSGESSEAASALVTGSAYEDSVKRICEMGFPEDQVKQAMRAAFNNPDRAVEFLFSGIPDIPEVTTPSQRPEPSGPRATESNNDSTPASNRASDANNTNRSSRAQGTPFDMFAAPEPMGGNATELGDNERTGSDGNVAGSGDGGNLDFLRGLPLFGQIRRLVQANPAALPQILQQLSALHPDLIPLIDANQEEFSRLLNEPVQEGEASPEDPMEQLAQAFAAGGGGMSPSASEGGGGTQIFVTAEERDQIDRLNDFASSIGLAQAQVLQTWLACGRNEDLTANFLCDHADELRADHAEEQAQSDDNDGNNNERGQESSGQDDSESAPRGPQS